MVIIWSFARGPAALSTPQDPPIARPATSTLVQALALAYADDVIVGRRGVPVQ
jgi:hypothetical protein